MSDNIEPDKINKNIDYTWDSEDSRVELQEKIADFFEKSIMDECLLQFEHISNELDLVRAKLYEVQESIGDFNEKVNPKKVVTINTTTKPGGKDITTSK